MDLVSNMKINLYSMIILFIIHSETLREPKKDPFQHKLFLGMVRITFILLAVDIFSRFDGNPGTIYVPINYWGNFVLFLASPVLPSFWLMYSHYQIFYEKESTKKLIYPLMLANLINAILLILTQFFSWYYYIDSRNIYHRGPLFLLSGSFTIVIILISFILIIKNRKKMEKKIYHSLLLFSALPVICLILQILFYGTSLMLNGVTIAILIVFISIQNYNMYTDYLTGINNRISLEAYLRESIEKSDENNSFAAIMIDLDGFKAINDNYGHVVGDDALKTSAKLIKDSIRSGDFIARFGGDEFWIVLRTSDISIVESILDRTKTSFENHNKNSHKKYKLSFSYGYGVYDNSSGMSAEEFEKIIDKLMYENKKDNKDRRTILV